MRRIVAGALWVHLWTGPGVAEDSLSEWVFPGSNGRWLYRPTVLADRIPDFSSCGYRGGTQPIPQVPVQITLAPVAGLADGHVQSAIDYVSALEPDADGFRGAVLLQAGTYDIAGSIFIRTSGVILRGEGTSATILRAAGTGQRTLVQVMGGATRVMVPGTLRNVTDKYVPVGARSFGVENTDGLAVGDQILVHRPATSNWIQAIGMESFGWQPGQEDKYFERVITRLEGGRITIDAPLPNSLDQQYGGGRIWKYFAPERISRVGIENLGGDSAYDPSVTATHPIYPDGGLFYADMNHANRFIYMASIEHGWIRDVTARHFGSDAVFLTEFAGHITVERVRCQDPVSALEGGWRYAFNNLGQLNLFRDCYDQYGRHAFAHQLTSEGPNVFVDCQAADSFGECGPRHRWTTAALYDNLAVTRNCIYVRNWGTSFGRGLTGANCVVWNCTADAFVVINPPTAQNWLVGNIGPIYPNYPDAGPRDPGIYDSPDHRVGPRSLYYAQTQQRRTHPRLAQREYWMGDIDHFTRDSLADEVPVDPTWHEALALRFSGTPLAGFDDASPEQIVPFTFAFDLEPHEQVVGAALSLRLRPSGGTLVGARLYLDDTSSLSPSHPKLPDGQEVVVVDLASHLPLLQDGRLNVAVVRDRMIDWAVLNLETAPASAVLSERAAQADAHVQDGPLSQTNLGSSPTLQTGGGSGTNAQAFLRFDLSGLSPTLTQAKVRLWPLHASPGIENAAALVADPAWDELQILWANQPLSGNGFASWLPQPGTPVEFDVTWLVREALLRGGQLSLRVSSTRPGSPGTVLYAAREHETAHLRPRLLVLTESPVMSAIPDQSTPINTALGPLTVTVHDAESAPDLLTLRCASSDPALLPDSNILVGGSDSNRTLTLVPTAGRTGVARVTVEVTDSEGASTSQSFLLTIGPVTGLDTDEDGMPDEFEVRHGLDPFAAGDASLDPDEDGATNLGEHQAGTDPTQATSVFRITDVALAQNAVALFFPTVTGTVYRVERNEGFSPDSWSTWVTNLAGTGRLVRVEDSLAGAGARFYRVALSTAP